MGFEGYAIEENLPHILAAAIVGIVCIIVSWWFGGRFWMAEDLDSNVFIPSFAQIVGMVFLTSSIMIAIAMSFMVSLETTEFNWNDFCEPYCQGCEDNEG